MSVRLSHQALRPKTSAYLRLVEFATSTSEVGGTDRRGPVRMGRWTRIARGHETAPKP